MVNDKVITRTFNFTGHEHDIATLAKLFRHIEYLGVVGASRNILVRVDGDGSGRITVTNLDGTSIDNNKYSTEQIDGALVEIYDIG